MLGSVQPRARPAEPQLGIDVFNATTATLDLRSLERSSQQGPNGSTTKLIKTGVGDIDEALKGGFIKGDGGMVNVCGEGDAGRELLLITISNHLITETAACVAVLDTAGTFPLLSLYETILKSLRKRYAIEQHHIGAHDQPLRDVELEAEKALERVRIMRVFDLVGIREAVAEVVANLQSPASENSVIPVGQTPSTTKITLETQPADAAKAMLKTVIADSQEEDDEEMLWDLTPAEPAESSEKFSAMHKASDKKPDDPKTALRTEILVVDNLTTVFNPIMQTNFVQAHALMTTFLRTLVNLTRARTLLTLVLTSATPQSSHTISVKEGDESRDRSPRLVAPSIFSSNRALPSLGHSFPYFMDVVLLVTRLPMVRKDARQYHVDNTVIKTGDNANIRTVMVAEVILDRYGGRTGRWGLFQ